MWRSRNNDFAFRNGRAVYSVASCRAGGRDPPFRRTLFHLHGPHCRPARAFGVPGCLISLRREAERCCTAPHTHTQLKFCTSNERANVLVEPGHCGPGRHSYEYVSMRVCAGLSVCNWHCLHNFAPQRLGPGRALGPAHLNYVAAFITGHAVYFPCTVSSRARTCVCVCERPFLLVHLASSLGSFKMNFFFVM